MMYKKTFCLSMLVIISAWLSFPQAKDFDPYLGRALQSALDEATKSAKLTGVSAAVYGSDDAVWTGVSGYSDPSVDELIDPQMLFGFGSITKTLISALILQFVEEKQLTLDDPISQWLPTYNNINGDISIRQLLNHTSGVYDIASDDILFLNIALNPNRFWQPEEIINTYVSKFFYILYCRSRFLY